MSRPLLGLRRLLSRNLSTLFLLALAPACAVATVSGGDGNTDSDGSTDADGSTDGDDDGTDAGASGGSSSGGGSSTGGSEASGGSESTGGSEASGGSESSGGNESTGGSQSTGGTAATGGAPGSGGASGSGGAPGSGGAASDCEEVECGGTLPKPTGTVCFTFTTTQFGGWQASNTTGCTITFDGAPNASAGANPVSAGEHELEFSGCTSPDVSWSCWK